MKNIIKCVFCLMGLFFSMTTYAARPVQGDCSHLQINKGFDVVFRVSNVEHRERVILTGQNGNQILLWSNVPGDNAVIQDIWTVSRQSYDMWLHYIPGRGNKSGMLQYYFYRWDFPRKQWGYANQAPLNLHHFSNNVYVSGWNTEILNCDGTIEPLPKTPSEPDHCELFPGPAQTWQGNPNNLITMENSGEVWNADERRLGFSNEIVNPDNYWPSFTPYGVIQRGSCGDNKPCELNGKMASEIQLNWAPPYQSGQDFVVSSRANKMMDAEDDGLYFHNLTVDSGGHLTMRAGHYWFDTVNIQGVLTVDGQVTLHVKERLDIGHSGKVNTSKPADNLTVFAYYDAKSCPLTLNHYQHPDTNTLYGAPKVNNDYAVNINGAGTFNGRIYSRGPVALSNNTTLNGAVTACQLELSNRARIVGNSECFNPQPKKDVLGITPQQAFGLTCERMPVTFSVRKDDGKLNTEYEGVLSASVTSSSPEKSCWALSKDATQCSLRAISQPFTNGQLTLWLESKKVGDITIEGLINDLSDSAGPYRFAPYGFRVNRGTPVSLVAGNPDRVLVEVVADTGKGCETIQDYSEEAPGALKKLSFQSLSYVRPTTINRDVEIDSIKLSAGEKKEHVLTFTNGWAWLPVKYNDAGEISFELVDKAWQPKECDSSILDCEDFERDWKGLAGKAVIYSRPYTFAMCDIRSASGVTDFSGTASNGNAFAKAGEAFSVTFKPVAWSPVLARRQADFSRDNKADIITTDPVWCREGLSTPNYYSVPGEITAPMVLSHKLATPTDGEQGLLQGSGTYSFANTQEASNGLTLDNLSWSEVGSLWLQADADYLGMTVNQGVGALGRFYPHHFALKSSRLVDAVPNKFTYMDQAFSASFKVEAQNKDGGATLNYGGFDPELQEKLDLEAVGGHPMDSAKYDLTSRLDKDGLFSGWNKATLEVSNRAVGFKRDVTDDAPKTTTPDGPYDVAIGLVVDRGRPVNCNERGCTDFDAKDLEVRLIDGSTPEKATALDGNIHARYGRLKLEDVNTQFDKAVNIPLRAEYWDSAQNTFVLNTDDGISGFQGASYCKQLIWPTNLDEVAKSKSYTQGNGKVKNGESYMLEATPARNDYFREQVRFWQRLTSNLPEKKNDGDNEISCFGFYSNQPWLTYNWRGIGDEDPSAVVTFGVYRGNDRIIYRGEKGMNQLLH